MDGEDRAMAYPPLTRTRTLCAGWLLRWFSFSFLGALSSLDFAPHQLQVWQRAIHCLKFFMIYYLSAKDYNTACGEQPSVMGSRLHQDGAKPLLSPAN